MSGAAAVSTKSGSALGLAGAVTVNIIKTMTTYAVIQDSSLSNVTGAVAVTASNGAEIISIAAGLAGAARGYGIAGSVAYNTINTDDTEAYITGGGAITASSLAITATDGSSIITVAGSLAYGGTLGIGAGVAYNDISPTVEAYLSDADATVTGAVTVAAENQSFITAVAAGIAVADAKEPEKNYKFAKPKGFAIAVGLAIDAISANVDAYVAGDGTDTLSAGSLAVTANDDHSQIVAVAGGVAVGLSKGEQSGATAGAGGAAFAINNIDNSIDAYLSDITVITPGTVFVTSQSNAFIGAYAIGGAVAGATSGGDGGSAALAGAGAITLNTIKKDVLASIQDNSTVTTPALLAVSATDQSTITAVAGGIAISAAIGSSGSSGATAVSVGISVAINTIEDKTKAPGLGGVQAYIDASTVAAGGLDVTASSTPTITVVSFAGGLAVAAATSPETPAPGRGGIWGGGPQYGYHDRALRDQQHACAWRRRRGADQVHWVGWIGC